MDNGEQADGYVHGVALGRRVKLAPIALADAVWNAAVGLGPAGAVAELGGKRHGLGHLNCGLGHGPGIVGELRVIGAAAGVEYLNAALAAIEDHFFVKDSHAADGHRAGGRPAEELYGHVEEEGHINGVEALVKGDGLQVDVNGDDRHVPHAHIGGAVDHGLAGGGKEDAEIFNAIFVAAGIVDPFRVNTNRLF